MSGIDVGRVALDGNFSKRLPPRKLKAPRPRKGNRFLKGPIPWAWLVEACNLPGQCAQLALALWFLSGARKSRTVSLSSQITAELGISRNAKRRALEWLEGAGLVSVERRTRKAPLVTLLEKPGNTSAGSRP